MSNEKAQLAKQLSKLNFYPKTLPFSVWPLVLSFLPPEDLLILSRVCIAAKEVVEAHLDWKKYLRLIFPYTYNRKRHSVTHEIENAQALYTDTYQENYSEENKHLAPLFAAAALGNDLWLHKDIDRECARNNFYNFNKITVRQVH